MSARVLMTRITRGVLAMSLAVGLCGNAIAEPLAPERLIVDITNELRARLEQPVADPAHRRQVIVDLVVPHFDFTALTRGALGAHWPALSDGEKRCMTAGLRDRLIERYAEYIVDFDYRSIETLPPDSWSTNEPALVRQHVVTANPQPLELGYKLEFINDTWKLTDLSVDGVSLVASHERSFDEQIASDGIGDFLRTFPSCRER